MLIIGTEEEAEVDEEEAEEEYELDEEEAEEEPAPAAKSAAAKG